MLKPVEQRVESAGAELIAVAGQLLDKPEAENRFLGGMVKDVKPNHPSIEILVCPIFVDFYFHPALNQSHSHSRPHGHYRPSHNPSKRAETDDVQQPFPY